MRLVNFLVAGAVAVVAVGLAATPAMAGPTDITFEVDAGTLDIAEPLTADLGLGAPGVDAQGSLGDVTVTDGRASADASWTASVISTDFAAGAAASQIILASEVEYWSGPGTAESGDGTFTPGQVALVNNAALANVTTLPAFTHAGGTGNNTVTWTPGITIHTPLDSQAGDYTGTVTHSVI